MVTVILRSGAKRQMEIVFEGTDHIIAINKGKEISLPRNMIREIVR